MGNLKKIFNGGLYLILFVALVSCASTAGKRSAGEVFDDAVVSNKVKAKLLKDKGVSGHKVNVDTWKGVVSLRGNLKSQAQVNRAIVIAERQAGVREVKSYLTVDRDVLVVQRKPAKKSRIQESEIGNQPAPQPATPEKKESIDLDTTPRVTE